MQKMFGGVIAATVMLAGATVANAATNVAGLYASYGTVATATSQCSAVGLAQGAGNFSEITFPGDGKTGLTIYSPASGLLQLCNKFPAVPAGGLNGFSAKASCAIYSINGNIPAESVNFSFKQTPIDANSAVGTTTVTIPAADPVGGGCTATINTTTVRTGK